MREAQLAVWLAPLLLASSVEAQAPGSAPETPATPLTFGAAVELVTVDAVVVDKQGRPVTGLKQSDFVVAEEGLPQQLVSFEAVDIGPLAPVAVARRQPISTNTGTSARTERLFVVVFDDMHLNVAQAQRGKQAIAEFLRTGVREGDRVVLLATSGGSWWSARMEAGREELIASLKRLEGRRIVDFASQDRLTDQEALRIVHYRDPVTADRVERRFSLAGLTQELQSASQTTVGDMVNPFVETRARQVYEESRVRNRLTLGALERVIKALTLAKGRKSLILVSEGLVQDPTLDGYKDVVRAARSANVAIYFVDTRGLDSAFSPFGALFGAPVAIDEVAPIYADLSRDADGSTLLASDTGGFTVHDTDDLAGGFARIAQESQTYYLLGYNPAESFQDGRFRKIDVRVNRKGVTVRARRGYYSPGPAGAATDEPKPEGHDPLLQQAVDAPIELDGIPVRMTAYAFGETLIDRAKVLVAAEIDLRKVAFADTDGRLVDSLDVLLVVSHRETGEYFQYPETISMRLRPQTLEQSPWYPVLHEFELGPGSYHARIVVRDRNNDRLGSLTHPFEIPDLGAFRASSLIITDKVKPSEQDPQVPLPVMIARRTFRPEGKLYCQVEVYNAERETATGMPRVTHGFTLADAQGRPVRTIDPTPIAPTPSGALSRLLGFDLDGTAPGEYQIVVSLKDEVSGKALEIREQLELVAGEPGA